MTVELPFTLTHPKPPDEMMASAVSRTPTSPNSALRSSVNADNGDALAVDPELIHIDTRYDDATFRLGVCLSFLSVSYFFLVCVMLRDLRLGLCLGLGLTTVWSGIGP